MTIRRSATGFTLLELVVTIAILALLAGLVTPALFRNVSDAKVTAAKADLVTIGLALESYALTNGSYPTSDEGLAALVRPPTERAATWRGPYLKGGVPRDPWGFPYVYANPGIENVHGYDLFSRGKDGRAGGMGENADLRAWDAAEK